MMLPYCERIDLSDEEKGTLCLCCEEFPAMVRDPHVGPVCLDCCIDLLRAQKALMAAERRAGRP